MVQEGVLLRPIMIKTFQAKKNPSKANKKLVNQDSG